MAAAVRGGTPMTDSTPMDSTVTEARFNKALNDLRDSQAPLPDGSVAVNFNALCAVLDLGHERSTIAEDARQAGVDAVHGAISLDEAEAIYLAMRSASLPSGEVRNTIALI